MNVNSCPKNVNNEAFLWANMLLCQTHSLEEYLIKQMDYGRKF